MTTAPNPVLFYHPDAYATAREDLKGRHAAGESFLEALLQQAAEPDVYALCRADNHFAAFADTVRTCGRPLTARRIARSDVDGLRAHGLVHLPIPGVAEEARLRGFLGADAYAVCGVTHTIASRAVLDSIADLCVAPVAPWDALICTSRPVHAAVASVIDATEDHLRERLGATRFSRPLLPVIPLGLHSGRFARDEAARKRWRAELAIAEEAVVVLFFGRLSVHAKASPFQLAQAVERAADGGRVRLELIWCGRFNNDFQETVFMKTAKAMAPSVRFHHVHGGRADAPTIRSAADIFCSLSDNIQESFGLTVIEAMAAGLPVVVSNWDGYRDTVSHGETGLLVDSYMPPVSQADAAYRYLSGLDDYDRYIGGISQFCATDLGQTAHWLAALAADRSLREKLGRSAQRHVAATFDWQVVLAHYRALWREQLDRLAVARAGDASYRAGPERIYDPSVTFADFSSRRFEDETLLGRGPLFAKWNALIRAPGVVVNPQVLAKTPAFGALRAAFAQRNPLSVEAVRSMFPDNERATVERSLYWLVKIGLLQRVDAASTE